MPNQSPRINNQVPDKVIVGRIVQPWGFKGDVKVEVLTDFLHRFEPGSVLAIDNRNLTCKTVKHLSARSLVISFFELDHFEDVRQLRGSLVEINGNIIEPLPAGTYYHYQLMGLRVETIDRRYLGCITDIIVTGANDVYLVNGPDGEFLLPAITDVICEISLEHNRMTVSLLPMPSPHSLELRSTAS